MHHISDTRVVEPHSETYHSVCQRVVATGHACQRRIHGLVVQHMRHARGGDYRHTFAPASNEFGHHFYQVSIDESEDRKLLQMDELLDQTVRGGGFLESSVNLVVLNQRRREDALLVDDVQSDVNDHSSVVQGEVLVVEVLVERVVETGQGEHEVDRIIVGLAGRWWDPLGR